MSRFTSAYTHFASAKLINDRPRGNWMINRVICSRKTETQSVWSHWKRERVTDWAEKRSNRDVKESESLIDVAVLDEFMFIKWIYVVLQRSISKANKEKKVSLGWEQRDFRALWLIARNLLHKLEKKSGGKNMTLFCRPRITFFRLNFNLKFYSWTDSSDDLICFADVWVVKFLFVQLECHAGYRALLNVKTHNDAMHIKNRFIPP